ncbi:hypothetical protein SAMN05421770_101602 [Granulicella rosea]|uniref:DUF1579 domain-containing protein n=1 Tax=Granulicella rosea TaxID=474952 RepID=A0A239DQH6_9BACT|nr:hypothetical protein [Granulicella rosea]SNS34760.1 hypothetical protein SAMN05421770_101602 [Granulicella rosea]
MTILRALALSLALSVPTAAQVPPSPASRAAGVTQLNTSFHGRWVGQLEYRDFQTNAQTFLPTWLAMTPSADGNAVTLDYIYDDGPAKTVRERETLAFTVASAGGMTASVTSDRDHTSETYAVAGLEEFRKLGRGVLTLTGPGRENDKPVDVRITLTMRRNLFTWRKETRPSGGTEEFKFRDAYTFTRSEPPAL